MKILDAKIALVTGGNRGIGKAIAQKLASEGAHVAICGTNKDTLEQTVQEIEKSGGSASSYALNVASLSEVQTMINKILDSYQRIDILVNNAGITRDNLLVRMSEEDWDRVLDINLKGTFNCTKAVLKPMMKARVGRVVNVSSVVGVSGNPGQANYAASKAGVIGFSKSVAKEVASRNITVNVIAPGYIDTDMTRALPEKTRETVMDHIPVKRFGEVEDIANAILFLTSESASYITGQVLHVDGGMVM